jgi:hypothetical protein
MHLRSGHLVHNLEVTTTIDSNSSNVIRNIQGQLQLMRAEMSNMSNKMNNLSRRVESVAMSRLHKLNTLASNTTHKIV